VVAFAASNPFLRLMVFSWQTEDREFLIRVSYMEIYNEEINDLLNIEGQKLEIHENLKVTAS
jgi:hypothetical protein